MLHTLLDAHQGALLQFKFPPTQPKLSEKFPVRRFDFDGRSLSDAGFELLSGLLTLDPERRLTADQALSHKWYAIGLQLNAATATSIHQSINQARYVGQLSWKL